MPQLREVRNCPQVPGERPRRWFESEGMDLIVWLSADGRPVGFQLCYDKGRRERALTFAPEGRLLFPRLFREAALMHHRDEGRADLRLARRGIGLGRVRESGTVVQNGESPSRARRSAWTARW